MSKSNLRSVAFVCLSAYPLFDKRIQSSIGGMETRSVLFAKALAKTNRWKTYFSVHNYGQAKLVTIDDIELVIYSPFIQRVYNNVERRFYKYKWRPVIHLDKRDISFIWHFPIYLLLRLFPMCIVNRFWQSLKPEVVFCFGNNQTSAEVIADCYRSGIKTVLCIASDDDLSSSYKPGDKIVNDYGTPRWMAWYAINTADYIFVQTERQRVLLEQHFNRTGNIIHNPVSISAESRLRWPQRGAREFVLWIGRSDTFHKRPMLMLELAKACPDIEFVMIVNKTNARVFATLQSERPANVTIIERVPHHEIWDYYHRARIFVSTSAYEGFPNTFLQAAVSGVPVASLDVDTEDILSKHECGIFAKGNFDLFVQAVRSLWSDNGLAECYAERFFDYVLTKHSIETQIVRFESLLEKVISIPTPESSPGCWHKPFLRFVRRVAHD